MSESKNANSIQVGGDHYRKGAYQHWDYVNDTGMGYFEANATKYICRHRSKGGALDLTKALHYIAKLAELEAAGDVNSVAMRPGPLEIADALYKLTEVYKLSDAEQMAVRLLSIWHDASDLKQAHHIVAGLFKAYTQPPSIADFDLAASAKVETGTFADVVAHNRAMDNPHHGHDDEPDYTGAENSGGRD